VSCIVHKGGQ
jgi:hypothetical protein